MKNGLEARQGFVPTRESQEMTKNGVQGHCSKSEKKTLLSPRIFLVASKRKKGRAAQDAV